MAKYNILPKKEKAAKYQTLLSEETKDRLHDEILRLLVSERKILVIVLRNLPMNSIPIQGMFLQFVLPDSTRTTPSWLTIIG